MNLFIRIHIHDEVSPVLKQISEKLQHMERQRQLALVVDKSHAAHMQRVLSLRGFDAHMN